MELLLCEGALVLHKQRVLRRQLALCAILLAHRNDLMNIAHEALLLSDARLQLLLVKLATLTAKAVTGGQVCVKCTNLAHILHISLTVVLVHAKIGEPRDGASSAAHHDTVTDHFHLGAVVRHTAQVAQHVFATEPGVGFGVRARVAVVAIHQRELGQAE